VKNHLPSVALLIGFCSTSVFAEEEAFITNFSDAWNRLNICTAYVYPDPALSASILNTDRRNLEAAQEFMYRFARKEFGEADANKLHMRSLFGGSSIDFRNQSQEKKTVFHNWCRKEVEKILKARSLKEDQ